jgi:hypothetical protein
MFIRERHVKGPNGTRYTYYGIVETVRVDGKPRQKLLYNMGKRRTITECIAREALSVELWEVAFKRSSGGEDQRREIEWHRAKIEFLKDAAAKLGVE